VILRAIPATWIAESRAEYGWPAHERRHTCCARTRWARGGGRSAATQSPTLQ